VKRSGSAAVAHASVTGKLTVNAIGAAETYVALHVTGDITGQIAPNVHLQVYFDGNMDVKARDLGNNTGLAGNLQFYGISPPRDANEIPQWTQTINLNSGTPSTLTLTFYAPSADIILNGNPDFIGSMACKTFYGNGNVSWHYDRALNSEGEVLDFRIAGYVEDTR
jgi:hypothetical protein